MGYFDRSIYKMNFRNEAIKYILTFSYAFYETNTN